MGREYLEAVFGDLTPDKYAARTLDFLKSLEAISGIEEGPLMKGPHYQKKGALKVVGETLTGVKAVLYCDRGTRELYLKGDPDQVKAAVSPVALWVSKALVRHTRRGRRRAEAAGATATPVTSTSEPALLQESDMSVVEAESAPQGRGEATALPAVMNAREQYLSANRVAKMHHVTPSAVYLWLATKILPGKLVSDGGYKRWMIAKKDAETFVPPQPRLRQRRRRLKATNGAATAPMTPQERGRVGAAARWGKRGPGRPRKVATSTTTTTSAAPSLAGGFAALLTEANRPLTSQVEALQTSVDEMKVDLQLLLRFLQGR